MASIRPLDSLDPDHPQIRFVNEVSRVERVARCLTPQLGVGDGTQLVVHARHQTLEGVGTTRRDVGQHLCQRGCFVHDDQCARTTGGARPVDYTRPAAGLQRLGSGGKDTGGGPRGVPGGRSSRTHPPVQPANSDGRIRPGSGSASDLGGPKKSSTQTVPRIASLPTDATDADIQHFRRPPTPEISPEAGGLPGRRLVTTSRSCSVRYPDLPLAKHGTTARAPPRVAPPPLVQLKSEHERVPVGAPQ